MKSVISMVLGIIILAMFANIPFVESTTIEYKITKISISDFKGIKEPDTEKAVRIIQITKSRMLSALYVVTIEVCAGREKIYSPELELKSDRDTMRIKLVGLIMPKACKSSDFFILANNQESISVNFYSRK